MNITFRKANPNDTDFLTEGIISAEMSGGFILPYTALFGLSETETKKFIVDVFEEEIEDQEWFIPHFTILEVDGQRASCLSSWIECKNGIGSGVLKAQAMAWILQEKWALSKNKLELLKSLQLPRVQFAVQLECIYTVSEYRGLGLASKLIDYCIQQHATHAPKPHTAEIQLLQNNQAALRSYTKCGFLHRGQATSSDPEILTLLAHHTRVSLTKPL
ncbi:MAG: hypothetical protein RLZZ161_401 [Bacteroidota bacterium]|jgi:ribosomal protein S18 acetylase RimI-like enzyme